MNVDEVLQGRGDKEELLLETQFFAFGVFVVRVENFGDVLRLHFVVDGAKVIGGVERLEIERFNGLGFQRRRVLTVLCVISE